VESRGFTEGKVDQICDGNVDLLEHRGSSMGKKMRDLNVQGSHGVERKLGTNLWKKSPVDGILGGEGIKEAHQQKIPAKGRKVEGPRGRMQKGGLLKESLQERE